MRGWLVALGAIVGGCNSSSHARNIDHFDLFDAGGGADASLICSPLLQIGCAAGQKCTWVQDQAVPQPSGHIDCVPDGTVPAGGACTTGAPGATGFDNCKAGSYCESGTCAAICDPQGGAALCPTGLSCAADPQLFTFGNTPPLAGVCAPVCDPLADNDLLGSGSRAGSACAAGAGCYGLPDEVDPTVWRCMPELAPTLVHRSPCTVLSGCLETSGVAHVNGCAQGYVPVLYDATGSMQVVCIAVCKPGNTYAGNPDPQYPAGQSPHACSTSDARGAFNTATATNDGDHCMFSWRFEVDPNGQFVRSATSDTVGFCVDHSQYLYDSNGDGMIDSYDQPWPLCSSLADGSAAAQFGCVDTMHAGLAFGGKASLPDLPLRLPYGRMR